MKTAALFPGATDAGKLDDAGRRCDAGAGVHDGCGSGPPKISCRPGPCRQALGRKDQRAHFDNQHLFVIGAIENADAAALRQCEVRAPEEVSPGTGMLEAEDLAALRIQLWPDITSFIAPSLPAASMAWKINNSE